ncbi:hypothetical protein ACCO45_009620 [Purpureocillium lilacinum]|uniref:Uncharacterized protein n=1 Tax=Purpureocillium lilacinum TaxID=33203 RepID=A0ACC4DMJ2_PURLI|nr:hypothetical protein PLICBS_006362 [Purpureocillium lilacinum]
MCCNANVENNIVMADYSHPSLWQCCHCDGGWFSVALDASCPSCLNYRCSNCQYSFSS